MGENKNYFAMSLKAFFIKLSTKHPELLELMCHNYVHQWVNKDAQVKKKMNPQTSDRPQKTKSTPARNNMRQPPNAYGPSSKKDSGAMRKVDLPMGDATNMTL
jgi:hypothetical protein